MSVSGAGGHLPRGHRAFLGGLCGSTATCFLVRKALGGPADALMLLRHSGGPGTPSLCDLELGRAGTGGRGRN